MFVLTMQIMQEHARARANIIVSQLDIMKCWKQVLKACVFECLAKSQLKVGKE